VSPSDPATDGEVRYVDGVGFRFKQGGAVVGLGGSYDHDGLTTFTHEVVAGAWTEVLRENDAVTGIICWTSPSKVLKIREMQLTRDGNGDVSQIDRRQYDGSGAQVQRLVITLTRDGEGRVSALTQVRT
jgi:hypothetical protein